MHTSITTKSINELNEYIYLLWTRESIDRNEPVYKMGRTSKHGTQRYVSYPTGSRLLLHVTCVDSMNVEKNLLDVFKSKFQRCERCEMYGIEYFNGDFHVMIETIMNYLNYPCCLDEQRRIRTKMRDMQQEIHRLNRELFSLSNHKNTPTIVNKSTMTMTTCFDGVFEDSVPVLKNEYKNSDVWEDICVDNDGNNRFKCKRCEKELCSKFSLQKHLKTCTGVSDPLTCPHCHKTFSRRQGKYEHIKKNRCPVLNKKDEEGD